MKDETGERDIVSKEKEDEQANNVQVQPQTPRSESHQKVNTVTVAQKKRASSSESSESSSSSEDEDKPNSSNNVKTIVARSRVRKIPTKKNNESDSEEEYTIGNRPNRGGKRGRPPTKDREDNNRSEDE